MHIYIMQLVIILLGPCRSAGTPSSGRPSVDSLSLLLFVVLILLLLLLFLVVLGLPLPRDQRVRVRLLHRLLQGADCYSIVE